MAKNSLLFDADTVAKKPAWLQRQLAGLLSPTDEPEPTRKPAHRRLPSRTIAEQAVRVPPLEPPQGETLYSGRVSVRIVSHRRRLLDPDNLCAKWFLDACRYSRLISDDRPEDITYQVSQIKVRTKAEEHTEVILTPIQ